jgi:AGCS family alanine or glycine:cation symporter
MEEWMTPDITKMITGFILATLVGFVVIGGVKSIARWCMALVPLMAVLYVVGCLYILCVNHNYLGEAFSLIFQEAFSLKAVGGGTAGTVLMVAARYGIDRGRFSKE